MAHDLDFRVEEPAAARPAMRGDLVFSPREFGGQPCCVIEDPLRSKFFRVGWREFTFISLLDGGTTIAEALGLAARTLGREALSEAEALGLCRWLVDSQLATTDASSQAPRLTGTADRAARQRRGAWLNPLSIKVPLCNPDRMVARLLPWCGWVFTWPVMLAWGCVSFWALVRAWVERESLATAAGVVFDPANGWRLLAAWVALKVLHETAHALVCKKYGGHVPTAGILLMFFTPLVFVDVTSSWRFRSKWQRIATAAAGIYIESWAAAVALLIALHASPGALHYLAYSVAIMASITTLVFNGNPLLRFDGYFILADLMETPNLSTSGRQYLSYLVRRHVCGLATSPPAWPPRRATAIKVYGVAAVVFRAVLCLSILLALVGMFSYAGGLLAVFAGALWFGIPLAHEIRDVAKAVAVERPSRRRLLLVAATAAGCGALVLFGLCRPARIKAPAVVEYAPLTIVRAAAPGFVKQVFARSGGAVEPGQVIVRMENRELELKRTELALARSVSLAKSRGYQQNNELAKGQIETANRESLDKQLREIDDQIDSLTIRATARGRVIGRNLDFLTGQYLRAGAEIAVIGDENSKELILAVAQDDVDLFAAQRGGAVDVRIAGNSGGPIEARLARVDPRAQLELPHPALSAQVRGPLAVKAKPASNDSAQRNTPRVELLSPRFAGAVELSPEQSRAASAGQLASVSFRSPAQSVGGQFYRWATQWVRQRTTVNSKRGLSYP